MVKKNKAIFILLATALLVSCSRKSETIKSLSQLNNKNICILTGSAGDIAARKAFPQAHFLDMVNGVDAALSVKKGKADAFVYDKSVLIKLAEKNPDLTILDEPVSKLEIAAVISKDNSSLTAEISNAINELKKNGSLDYLKNKWIDSKYTDKLTLPAAESAGKNGTLKMGTYSNLEPFSFISHGACVGFDIELSGLIGKLLGKKIEIVDMTFDSLIPALRSGKIDFALSNFNITEERKKLINFSVPYLTSDISAIVKK